MKSIKTSDWLGAGAALLWAAFPAAGAPAPQIVWETNAHPLSAVLSVAYSRDGRLLGSGGSDAWFNIWDATNHALVRAFDDHATDCDKGTCLAFSADGLSVAGGTMTRRGFGKLVAELDDGSWVLRRVTFTRLFSRQTVRGSLWPVASIFPL